MACAYLVRQEATAYWIQTRVLEHCCLVLSHSAFQEVLHRNPGFVSSAYSRQQKTSWTSANTMQQTIESRLLLMHLRSLLSSVFRAVALC